MDQTAPSNPPGSIRALTLVMLAHMSTAFCAFGVPPLAPFFQPEMQISKTEVGLMLSSFYVGVVLGSVPAGYLSDRVKAKYVMAMGNALLGVFIFVVGTIPSFPLVLLLMAIGGLGYSSVNPVSTKVVMAWFQPRRRATAMSIKQMGVTLGGVLTAASLPSIATAFGWHFALQFAGVFTVACGIAIGFLYREAPQTEEVLPRVGRRIGFLEMLANRQIVLIGVVSGIYNMAQASVVGYLVLFLHDAQLIPAVVAGFSLAVAQSSGTVGRIAWGYASDVVFHGGRRMTLMIIGLIIAGACLAASLLPPGVPVVALFVISAVFGASALGWNGVLLTLAGESSDKDTVGASSGLVSMFTFLGNVIWSPIFGYIVDSTGSFSFAWGTLAVVIIAAVGLTRFSLAEAGTRPIRMRGET